MHRFVVVFALLILMPAAALAQTTAAPAHQIIFGDIASQIIMWAIAAFGPLISAMVLALLIRMLKAAGLKNTDLLKDQLQKIIVNGINAGAARASQTLAGRGLVEVKNQAAIYAVSYAQEHGADIIKSLGLDPQSGEAVEAIKARIETALADPTSPTAASVTPGTVISLPNVIGGGGKTQ